MESNIGTSALDFRLCPISGEPRVALYPCCSDDTTAQDLELLKGLVADFFGVKPWQVFLRRSASSVLCEYLSKKYPTGSRIGFPSFSCPEVLASVLQSNQEPVLLPIDHLGRITYKAIKFAASQGVCCLLWPEYFGPVGRPPQLIEYAKQLNIDVILDDAQSFPGYPSFDAEARAKYPVLLSFGRSKRINGIGGGALILPESYDGLLLNELPEATQEQVYTLNAPIYADQLELLEERKLSSVAYGPILQKQARSAYYALSEKTKRDSVRGYYFNMIDCAMRTVFNPHDLQAMGCSQYGPPSTAAFLIPRHLRFNFMKHLANAGIQSTWYYLPLYALSFNKKFKSIPGEEMDLCQRIVILPCQPTHTSESIEFLCSTILKFR